MKRTRMNKLDKILSFVLAILMVATLIVPAIAENDWTTNIQSFEAENPVFTTTVQKGTAREEIPLPETLRVEIELEEQSPIVNDEGFSVAPEFIPAEPSEEELEKSGYTAIKELDEKGEEKEGEIKYVKEFLDEDGKAIEDKTLYRRYGSLGDIKDSWFAADKDGNITGLIKDVPVKWTGDIDFNKPGEYTLYSKFSGYTYPNAHPYAVITVDETAEGEQSTALRTEEKTEEKAEDEEDEPEPQQTEEPTKETTEKQEDEAKPAEKQTEAEVKEQSETEQTALSAITEKAAEQPVAVTISSARLVVKAPAETLADYKDKITSSHEDVHLLDFVTLEEAQKAYNALKERNIDVTEDYTISMAAQNDNTAVPDVGNPINELNEILQEDIDKTDGASATTPTIALIDTGVNDNLITSFSLLNNGNVADDNGHGSEMFKFIREENKDADVISIKALDKNGNGTVTSIYAAIELAKEKGAKIINLSLSARETEGNAILKKAIDDALNEGIIVVAAAGNKGENARKYIPANIEGVTTVGAAEKNEQGEIKRKANSNYGSVVDYYVLAGSTSEAAARFSGAVSKNGSVEEAAKALLNGKAVENEEKDEETEQEIIDDTKDIIDGVFSAANTLVIHAPGKGDFSPGVNDRGNVTINLYCSRNIYQDGVLVRTERTPASARGITVSSKDGTVSKGVTSGIMYTIFNVRGMKVGVPHNISIVNQYNVSVYYYTVTLTQNGENRIIDHVGTCGNDNDVHTLVNKGAVKLVKEDQFGNRIPNVGFWLHGPNGFKEWKVTDNNGVALWYAVDPGTGYYIDEQVPQGYSFEGNSGPWARVKENITVTKGNFTYLTVTNKVKSGTVKVIKKRDTDGEPLTGVRFYLEGKDEYGNLVKREGLTDRAGVLTFTGIKPGTAYTLKEEIPANYKYGNSIYVPGKDFWGNVIEAPIVDVKTNIVVKEDKTTTVEVLNTPVGRGTVRVVKKDSVTGKPIPNVGFWLHHKDGYAVWETTSSSGIAVFDAPAASGFYIDERLPEGYSINGYSGEWARVKENIVVNTNTTTIVELTNDPPAIVELKKKDSATGALINGFQFRVHVTRSDGTTYEETKTSGAGTSTGVVRFNVSAGAKYWIEEYLKDNYSFNGHTQGWVRVKEGVAGKAGTTTSFEVLNDPPGTIRVIKKDSVTGKPIYGVGFWLHGDRSDGTHFEQWKETAGTGIAEWNNLPSGITYWIDEKLPSGYALNGDTGANNDGWVRAKNGVKVSPGQTTTIELLNTPISAIKLNVQVTKKSNNGKAISNVSFTLSGTPTVGGSFTQTVKTNASGVATFTNVPHGTNYTIKEVVPAGYVNAGTTQTVKTGFQATTGTPSITITNTAIKGTVKLKKTGVNSAALQGAAFKLTGTPTSAVEANQSDGKTFTLTGTTPASGELTFSNVPAGTYTLSETTTPAGYVATANKSITISTNGQVHQTYYTTPIANTPIKGTVKLKKTGNGGAALAGAKFTITGKPTVAALANQSDKVTYKVTGTTAADGTLTFSNVPAGTYTVEETTVPAGYVKAANKTVKITSNGQVEQTNFTTPIANTPIKGSIKMKKTGLNGVALAGAKFTITGKPTVAALANQSDKVTYKVTGTTASDGTLTFSNVPAGTYTVEETTVPAGYVKVANKTATISANGQVIDLGTLNDTVVKGSVKIKKTGINSTALAGAGFTLTGKPHISALANQSDKVTYKVTGTTPASGEITFANVPAGTYTLEETTTPAGYRKMSNKTVNVTENGKTVEVAITNDPAKSEVEITKTDHNGNPLAGVKFTLTGKPTLPSQANQSDGVTYKVTTPATNANGKVTIGGVPAGTYTLEETTIPAGFAKAANRTVTVKDTDKAIKVTVTNALLKGTIKIKKTGVNNAALAGAVFTITGKPTMPELANQTDKVTYKATSVATPASGEVTFTNVPAGTYTIEETTVPAGYVKAANTTATVSITTATVNVTINNTPIKGSVKLKKTGYNGVALSGVEFSLHGTPTLSAFINNTNKNIYEVRGKTASDGTLTFSNVPAGTYELYEMAAPAGYAKAANKTVTIKTNGQVEQTHFNTPIANTPIKGSIKLKKTGLNGAALKGAGFTITGKPTIPALANQSDKVTYKATGTTGSDGTLTFTNVPAGTYTVEETTVPAGYVKVANKTATITTNGQVVDLGTLNDAITQYKAYLQPRTYHKTGGWAYGDNAGGTIKITTGTNGKAPDGTAAMDWATEYSKSRLRTLDSSNNELKRIAGPYTYGGPNAKITVQIKPNPGYYIYWVGEKNADNTSNQKGLTGSVTDIHKEQTLTIDNNGWNNFGVYVSYGVIGGSVKLKKTGVNNTALAGAQFTLTGTPTLAEYANQSDGKTYKVTGTTASDGTLTFSSVPAGTYTVEETTVPAGYVKVANKTATITTNGQTVDLGTLNDAQIKGTVTLTKTGANNAALQGAGFTLTGKPTIAALANQSDKVTYKVTGTTNASGVITWTNVPAGTYTLEETTVPTGYVKVANKAVTVSTNGQTVNVGTLNDAQIKGSIKLKKTGASSAALAGAKFTITGKPTIPALANQSDKVTYKATGTTGSDGTLTFTNVPAGTYTVEETTVPAGYVKVANKTATITTNGQTVDLGTLNDAQVKGSIKLKKTGLNGAALQGAGFTITGKPTIPALANQSDKVTYKATGTTGSDGTLTFTNVPAGTYTVEETTVPAGYVKAANKTVTISTNGQVEQTNLTTPIANTPIKGTVKIMKTGYNNAALAGAGFTLTGTPTLAALANQSDGKTYKVAGKTSSTGELTFSNVPHGTYTLEETTVPTGYVKAANRTVKITSNGQVVELAINNANIQYKAYIQPRTQKKGTWVLGDNTGGFIKIISGTNGKAPDGSGAMDWATEKSKNRLKDLDTSNEELKYLAGPYTYSGSGATIQVQVKPNAGYYIYYMGRRSSTGANAKNLTSLLTDTTSQQTLNLDGGGLTDFVIWVSYAPIVGNVSLKKTGVNSAALQGAGFTLSGTPTAAAEANQSDNKTYKVTGTTAADGTLTFKNVPAGTYTLSETTVPAGYVKVADKSVTIATNGQTVNAGTLNDAYIKGTVKLKKTGNGGAALAGAGFTLSGTPTLAALANQSDGKTYKVTGTTPASGELTFSNVPAGTYTLSETTVPAGYVKAADKTVKITTNGQVEQTNFTTPIANTPIAGSVKVKKTGLNGAALAGAKFTLTGKPTIAALANQSDGVTFKVTSGATPASGEVTFSGVPHGTYTLEETTVPAGYTKAANQTVKVTSNGTIVNVTVNNAITQYNAYIQPRTYIKGTAKNADNTGGSIKITTGTNGKAPDGTAAMDWATEKTNKRLVTLGSAAWLTDLAGAYAYGGPSAKVTVQIKPNAGYYIKAFGRYGTTNSNATTTYLQDSLKTLTGENTVEVDNGGLTDFVIFVNYEPITGSVKLKKTGVNNAALAGAGFTLTGTPTAAAEANQSDNKTYKVTGTTASDGTLTFTGVPAGTYTLEETTVPAGYVKAANKSVTISTNGQVEQTHFNTPIANTPIKGNVTLTKTGVNSVALQGAGFTLTGKPTIAALANQSDKVTYKVTGTTNASGVITWTNVPAGTYTLEETTVPAGYVKVANKTVTVTANGATVNAGTLNDVPIKGTVTLTKTGVNSAALQGAGFTLTGKPTVAALANQSDKVTYKVTGTTNASGVITWTNVPAGTYTLEETTVPAGYVKVANKTVTVTANGATVNVGTLNDVPIKGTVTLTKTGVNSAALQGAGFTLTGKPTIAALANQSDKVTYKVTGTTNASGVITWTNVPAGTYTLEETTVPTGYIKIANKAVTVSTNGQTVNVGTYNDAQIKGSIKLKKTGLNGAALQGAGFTLTGTPTIAALANQSDGKTYKVTGTTPASGELTFSNVPAGTYTVEETTVPAGYVKVANKTATITTNGQTVDLGTLNDAQVKGSIKLKKTGVNGAALAGAGFTLTGTPTVAALANQSDGKTYKVTGTTPANGELTFSNVPAGTYTLEETTVPAGYVKAANKSITISANGQVHQANYTTPIANTPIKGSVKIKKTGLNGAALAGAKFTLTGKPTVAALANQSDGVTYAVTSAATPASGEVTISNVPAGTYTLEETTIPVGYVKAANQTVTVNTNGATVNVTVNNVITQYQAYIQPRTYTPSGWSYGDNTGGSIKITTGTNGKAPDGTAAMDWATEKTNKRLKTLDATKNDLIDNAGSYVYGGPSATVTVQMKPNPGYYIYWFGRKNATTATNSGSLDKSITDRYAQQTLTVDNGGLDKFGLYVSYGAIGGTVKVKKTGINNTALAGAGFTLSGTPLAAAFANQSDGKTYKVTGSTPASGELTFTNVPAGTYIIEETTVPAGYVKATNKTVTISTNGQVEQTNFTTPIANAPIKGTVKLKKTGADGAALAGAGFTLTGTPTVAALANQSDGKTYKVTGTTPASGELTFSNVPAGTYTLEETTVPAGYVKAANKTVTISTNGQVEQTNVTTPIANTPIKGTVKLKKTGTNNVELAGAGFTLSGKPTVAALANQSDGVTYKVTGTTLANGQLTFSNVPAGTYTLEESTVPAGYVKAANKSITISTNGQVEQTNFATPIANTPIKGSIIFKKIDSSTGNPLGGVKFKVTGVSDVHGAFTSTTVTTDAQTGIAIITGIPYSGTPNTYTLVETVPSGYTRVGKDKTFTINADGKAVDTNGKEVNFTDAGNEIKNEPIIVSVKVKVRPDTLGEDEPTGNNKGGSVSVNGNDWDNSKNKGTFLEGTVNSGSTATVTFKPNNGYMIKSVTDENGNPVQYTTDSKSGVSTATIENITSDKSVIVTYEAIPIETVSVMIRPDTEGENDPTGNNKGGEISVNNKPWVEADKANTDRLRTETVEKGSTPSIKITPNDGYRIKKIEQDGKEATPMPIPESGGSYTIPNIAADTKIVVTFEQAKPEAKIRFQSDRTELTSGGGIIAHWGSNIGGNLTVTNIASNPGSHYWATIMSGNNNPNYETDGSSTDENHGYAEVSFDPGETFVILAKPNANHGVAGVQRKDRDGNWQYIDIETGVTLPDGSTSFTVDTSDGKGASDTLEEIRVTFLPTIEVTVDPVYWDPIEGVWKRGKATSQASSSTRANSNLLAAPGGAGYYQATILWGGRLVRAYFAEEGYRIMAVRKNSEQAPDPLPNDFDPYTWGTSVWDGRTEVGPNGESIGDGVEMYPLEDTLFSTTHYLPVLVPIETKIKIKKIDSDGNPLDGARFEVTGSSIIMPSGTYTHTVQSEDWVNGEVEVTVYYKGPYTITEKEAPENYVLDPTPQVTPEITEMNQKLENGGMLTYEFVNEPDNSNKVKVNVRPDTGTSVGDNTGGNISVNNKPWTTADESNPDELHTETVDKGSTPEITITPKPGYIITKIVDGNNRPITPMPVDETGGSYTIPNIAEDTTIIVTFEETVDVGIKPITKDSTGTETVGTTGGNISVNGVDWTNDSNDPNYPKYNDSDKFLYEPVAKGTSPKVKVTAEPGYVVESVTNEDGTVTYNPNANGEFTLNDINETKKIVVRFVPATANVPTVTITNHTEGEYGDPDKPFDYTITFTDGDGNPLTEVATPTGTVQLTNGSITVPLKDGESVTYTVPEGTTVITTVDPNGYDSEYSVDGGIRNPGTTVNILVDDDTDIDVYNELNVVPTGIGIGRNNMKMLFAILSAFMVMLASALYIMNRKRKSEKNKEEVFGL